MNTDKIRCVVEAIEKGSLSAAAESLDYSISGVSRLIESLEKELNLVLLYRTKGGVKATAACHTLMPEMLRILKEEENFTNTAAKLLEAEGGMIRIGTAYAAVYPWLSTIMAEFRRTHPNVQYDIKLGYSSELLKMTERHELDLCIVSERTWNGQWDFLIQDEMVALLPPEHASAKQNFPLSAFETEEYLELHPDEETDNKRVFLSHSIKPQNKTAVDDTAALFSMVEAGLGIAMNNRINTLNFNGNVAIVPLDPPQIINIGIARSDDSLPLVNDFVCKLIEKKNVLW